MAAKVKAKRPTNQTKSNAVGRGKAWTFPKHTLEESVAIARAIEDKAAGNPMAAPDLARAVGFKQANDWRFLDRLRSANQYGLVQGTGANAKISLEKLGQDVVAPSSPSQRSEALRKAFLNVKEFADVDKYYGGKRIPEDEFFLNTLTREFNIPRDRAEQFSKVFVENSLFLKAFGQNVGIQPIQADGGKSEATKDYSSSPPERPREFLDTCFVMMPFGTWFDRYYQEIYVPAIKSAGFEPVRADELFKTGSVVEQIWEQIEKSKVLLADLSGKNPNVFYELGLAHAARKPVVFAASDVEDVPFDLRHLRVITYDIREPEWASRLRQNVTDYLRNAAKEPEKSIPHPFRNGQHELGKQDK